MIATIAAKLIAEGRSKLKTIRCLKRYIAREVFLLICRLERRLARCGSLPDKQKGIRLSQHTSDPPLFPWIPWYDLERLILF
jgi:hypothetical protein